MCKQDLLPANTTSLFLIEIHQNVNKKALKHGSDLANNSVNDSIAILHSLCIIHSIIGTAETKLCITNRNNTRLTKSMGKYLSLCVCFTSVIFLMALRKKYPVHMFFYISGILILSSICAFQIYMDILHSQKQREKRAKNKEKNNS